jgi:DNA polymerase III subunit beta
MVITTEKKEFSEAVNTVARFAERKSPTLAAISGIALVAGNDGIKLRATNLETGIDLSIPGSIKSPGVVVLPAVILRDIASSLTGSGTVTIEHAGETAVVTSGGAKSTLKTLPAEDFPIIPIPEHPEVHMTLPSTTISALIGSVVACASISSVRPELASVFLSAEGGVLKAVASDSFRLAEKKISIEKAVKTFSALIPAKNAADILQVLPETEVTFSLDEHQCAFSWDGGIVTTRLTAAQYPDYTQIIPKSFSAEANVLRKDFEAALRRVAVFSDTFQKVKVAFDVKGKRVDFSARNPDVGESTEHINASLTGESIELSFNHRYLASPLSLITSENLSLSSGGIGRPLVIRGSGDNSFLYLVMPMNQ